MTLRTGKDTLIWRRKLCIAPCGGTVLEEALDLSSDRLLTEWIWPVINTSQLLHIFSSGSWFNHNRDTGTFQVQFQSRKKRHARFNNRDSWRPGWPCCYIDSTRKNGNSTTTTPSIPVNPSLIALLALSNARSLASQCGNSGGQKWHWQRLNFTYFPPVSRFPNSYIWFVYNRRSAIYAT